MKIKEKISEFTKVAEKEAEKKSLKIIEELEKELLSVVEKNTKEAEEESKKKVNIEKTKIYQEKNKEIIEEITKAKKCLINLRKRYEDEIFNNIECKLKNFVKSDEYMKFLIKSIKSKLGKAENVKIFLTKEDYIHKDNIINEVKMNSLEILESDQDFIGGFIGKINNNIIVDYSFQTKLDEEREKFNSFKIN